jgi:hypothetical protein
VLRWLLVAVLACFVLLRAVAAAAGAVIVTDQSTGYYVVNSAVDLVPAAVEAVAVVLALRGRGGRLAWSVLLACGLALFVVQSYYALTVGGFGVGMLEGVALVALALHESLRHAALASEPGQGRGREVADN